MCRLHPQMARLRPMTGTVNKELILCYYEALYCHSQGLHFLK